MTGEREDKLRAFGALSELIRGGVRGLRNADVWRKDTPGVEGRGADGRDVNCLEVEGRGVAGRCVDVLTVEDDERLLGGGLKNGGAISFFV